MVEYTYKDILEWLSQVEKNLHKLNPENISSTTNLIEEFSLLNLSTAEEMLRNYSINTTINDKRIQFLKAFKPIVLKIKELYSEIKDKNESHYKDAFNKQLDRLIARNNLPKIYEPIISKTQEFLHDWRNPIKKRGLLLCKNGTYQVIEFFRNETRLAVKLINEYIPISELESKPKTKEPSHNYPDKNPYPRIFTSSFGFNLFEKLNENLIKCDTEKDTNQDVNFVYTQLHKRSEGYIFEEVKPEEFKKWLNDTYSDKYNLNKIKDGEGETEKKLSIYSTIKNSLIV